MQAEEPYGTDVFRQAGRTGNPGAALRALHYPHPGTFCAAQGLSAAHNFFNTRSQEQT